MEDRARAEEQFREIMRSLCAHRKSEARPYDAIMAYSGGKDSSYTLKVLKDRFDLKILAVTFDHGFLSPQAVRNIRAVTGALDVDHWMVTPGPGALKRAFVRSLGLHRYPMKALERASSVCNTCMHLVKSLVIKTAIEVGIPAIAYGWSPGQVPLRSAIMKTNLAMLRSMQDAVRSQLSDIMGDDLAPYLLQERHYRSAQEFLKAYDGHFLYAVYPLAFLPYDEDAILDTIAPLGWKAPADTDSNSTNCLLNAFANQAHIEAYGFHPYAFEVAGLVRGGHMTRDAGIEKISKPSDPRIIEEVKRRLGIG
ncbi:MAG: hypothetical protein M1550_04295 [Deltaproteobacteria bacterium]|nr:hypothetical protein [Deltaproteobacteria bacterium]